MDATVIMIDGYQRERWVTQLGEWLKARREALGWTQAELAERSGVSQSMVSAIEQGRRQWPSTGIRRKLARALGTTHLHLLIGAGEITLDEAGVSAADADPRANRLQAMLRDLSDAEVEMVAVFASTLAKSKRSRAD